MNQPHDPRDAALRRLLQSADPLRREAAPRREDFERIRRRLRAEASSVPHLAGAVWPGGWARAAALAGLLLALAASETRGPGRQPTSRPAPAVATSAAEAAAAARPAAGPDGPSGAPAHPASPPAPEAEPAVRQLHFVTSGGTRVFWFFESESPQGGLS
jgi:hypothetical protein